MRHSGLYEGLGRPVEGVASIAVLRANAVGDFIVATPALHALREAYPDAHISLLGRAFVTARDRAEAYAAVPPGGGPLVVLQPGATDPRRCWSPRHFARVGDHFAGLGAGIAVNGTRDEAAAVRAVIDAMHHRDRAIDLSGRLSLGGLMGLLERSRLLVSNDTGPMHMARALDVPTVAVYWIGNLPGHGPTSSARHAVAVSWRLDCPTCGRNCIGVDCGHDASFVDDVAPEEVIALAQPLYEGPAPADAMLPETREEPDPPTPRAARAR